MPLVSLLAYAPLVCCPCAARPHALAPQERESPPAPETSARFAWFDGTFDELLSEAARTKRVVFLNFRSETSTFSKKLERGTLADARVRAELAELLCYPIDAEAKETRSLRKRYQVQNAPVLVFLDPDGALRDQLSGYYSPDSFLEALRRIKSNTGTFSDLRTRIRADANDLD